MSGSEALREALIEVEILRAREAAAHRASERILSCLEAFNHTDGPEAGTERLLETLCAELGANAVAALHCVDRTCTVLSAAGAIQPGTSLTLPFDAVKRARNFADVSHVGRVEGDAIETDAAPRSLLSDPIDDARVIIATSTRVGAFKEEDMALLRRVSALVGQGLSAATLTAENALLAAAIQGSSSGFAIADARDPEKPLRYVNPAFEALSGYSSEEVLGRNCRFLNAEPDGSEEREKLRRTVAMNGSGRFLLRNKRKSGAPFWNDLTIFPVKGADGMVSHLVATQFDATVRVQAELERDASRARMEDALRATDDAFLIVSRDGQILFANDAVRRLFPSNMIDWVEGSQFSENWDAFLATISRPAARALRTPDFGCLAKLGTSREYQLPDGRTYLVNAALSESENYVVHATNITELKVSETLSQQRLAALDAARDGIAIVDEAGRIMSLNPSAVALLGLENTMAAFGRKWQSRYKDISSESAAEQTLTVTRNSRGNGAGDVHEVSLSSMGASGVLVIRDVSARKAEEAQLRTLNAALALAQRREATGQIAAGLAHDFNNTLSAIMGSASLISIATDATSNVHRHAERISTAGRAAERLVNRLLDLGSASEGEAVFDLHSVIRDLPALVEGSLHPQHTLNLTTTSSSMLAEGDPNEVSQVLVNLLLNARDAIGERAGTVDLTAKTVTPERAEVGAVGMLQAAQSYAVLDVSDDGHGISDEVREKLFEPYFSTKGKKGSGLGLAIAASVVRSVGGALFVFNRDGGGTTFRMCWPLHQTGSDAPRKQVEDGDASLKGRTILVVDDDVAVAQVVGAYLESLGAEVAICDDPRDAAEALEEDPQSWSALITDYDMPGLNGGALTERVLAARKDLPVFVITALARRITDQRLSDDKIAGLFAKPVDLRMLARVVESATAVSQHRE
jgi:PAS domain S-box-containing protein